VVTDYLDKAGLEEDLDAIGFDLVGYGCTTCIGNSGPLRSRSPRRSTRTISSPPRCFRATATSKGRVSPDVRANYLASPPLVVAYALKGTVTEDMVTSRSGRTEDGEPTSI
jgi:aconitate hydratase